MKDRDCENCVHARPFGGPNDNRCDAWECEYINRKEAIEAYKARRDIVRCGECKYMSKHYDTDGNLPFLICLEWDSGTDIDGYCYLGERRTDEHTD